MPSSIDYGNLMHDAMRGLIHKVLADVAKGGLPGEHHFFISFDTQNPDVELADWLADRFPDDMTIVIQHWFEDLVVTDEGFTITLNFGDQPERMFIPYDAIRTFVDPSVEFGLRFETQEEEEGGGETRLHEATPEDGAKAAPQQNPAGAGKVAKADKAAKAKPGTKAKARSKAKAEAKATDAEVVSLDAFRK